jgi:hypothetical protein
VDALDRGGRVATLRGYERRWQVAMDNRVDLPGYKYYVDSRTGERPPVCVAFLDLAPVPERSVKGVIFEAADLDALDDRERNYARREVMEGVVAYIGTPDARERYRRGPTVVCAEYLESVQSGLEQIGASTEPPGVPIRDLRRVDLP